MAESTGLMDDTIDWINHKTHTPNPVSDQLSGPQCDHLDFTSNLNIPPIPQGFDSYPTTGNVINYAFITNSKIRNTVMNKVVCINVTMRDPRITNTMILNCVDTNRIPTFTTLDNADIDAAFVFNSIIVTSNIDNCDVAESTLGNARLINPVFCPFLFPELPLSVQDNSTNAGVQIDYNITPDTTFNTPGITSQNQEIPNTSAQGMQGALRNDTDVAPQLSLNLLEEARASFQDSTPEIGSHGEHNSEDQVETSTENVSILPNVSSPIGIYATPISDCSTPYDKVAAPSYKPKKRTRKQLVSKGKRKRRTEPKPRVGNTNNNILALLKNCVCGSKSKELNNKQAREVQTVADYMIVNDCHALLQPQLKKWQKNLSSDKHALGFPPLEKSATAAAKYFELLQSERLLKYSLEHRMALISFYLIYLEIAREMRDNEDLGDYEPRSGDDRFTTMANDKILATIHGIKVQTISKEEIDRGRARLNEFHRWGKRWWTLASGVGLGVLLVPGEQLAMAIRNEKFAMSQINALITYIKAARPGCLFFFKSLENIAKAIMFGQLPGDLIQALNEKEGDLLGRTTLMRVNEQDEMSLSIQKDSDSWEDVEMESLALQKAALFFEP
ncbi:unnamed protein product [Penicillium salamii]|nr:unnamed protein product [Penicillium salamii]CAG8555163.1 unnamed protein product [Penicillium salamii]